MSLRSIIARGEKIFCSAATIIALRWSMPSDEICTTSTSSYLSTMRPLKKSLSAFTTRNERRVRQMFLPDGQRGADAFLEKFLIHVHAFRREDADVDFGFGIEEADAEQPRAMVFDLHQFAVGDGRGDAQNFAGINPRMTRDDAVGFARF